MKNFLDQDFLLQTDTARELYHEHAAKMPIIDYHCHLDPRQIAENHQFEDLTEIWLGGDHYKWRAMRANGIPEEYITGDKPSYEKFLKWAETMPYTMRNPLYHWTHLELKRYFNDYIVCIVGDCYSNYKEMLNFIEELEQNKIYGFFVLGNHDYWSNGQKTYMEIIQFLKKKQIIFHILGFYVPEKVIRSENYVS